MRHELFQFAAGATLYYYTSSDRDISYGGNTYLSKSIGHGIRESRTDINKAALDVSLDIADDLSVALLNTFGDNIITMTMFTQTSSGTEITWKGRVVSVQPSVKKLKITIESIFTSLRRTGIRARYQKNCRYALYQRGCDLDADDFDYSGTISAIDGSSITIPDALLQVDHFFTGGMIKATDNTIRFITSHVGSVIQLVRPFPSLSVSDVITLYPGCDHTRAACISKFDNVLNYGGFPWIPEKNPFGNSSIV